MLLRNLSDKAKANIERTNSGEAPEQPSRARVRERELAPSRSGAVDPDSVNEVSENFITDIVVAQDRISEEKRHNSGYSHVTSLLRGICPRQQRFIDEADQPEYETANGGRRIIWRMGRAAEAHIRDSYIKGIKGKGVIGKWLCKCERTSYEGEFQQGHRACPHCRTAPVNYNEITLLNHEAGVCGNPDFILKLGRDGTIHVVEIKSMNGEDFDELAAALPDHVYQAASYRRLLMENGYDNVSNKVFVIYVSKKYSFRGPFYKPFLVDVDTPSVNAVLDNAWETARIIRRARTDGVIPERTQCATPQSPQAKKCAFVTDCFMRS